VLGLLALEFWILIQWGARSRTGRLVFISALIVPLNALREVLSGGLPHLRGELLRVNNLAAIAISVLLMGVIIAAALVRWSDRIFKITVLTASIFVLVPVCVVQAAWKASRYDDTAFRDAPPAERVGRTATSRRVVWIVFDELDYSLTFEQRPAGIDMPEFTQLCGTRAACDRGVRAFAVHVEIDSIFVVRQAQCTVCAPSGPQSCN
jgi:hypothetical protein